ncbi:MAG: hypothetical protein HYZ54_05115 [Ignavibacteriae bacterium]|nr:hypothetical protein [Ignavibacteriota bacterium]
MVKYENSGGLSKNHEYGFEGYYYAFVPQWGITNYGYGLEGAKNAANDIIKLWIEERMANNEPIGIIEDVVLDYTEG